MYFVDGMIARAHQPEMGRRKRLIDDPRVLRTVAVNGTFLPTRDELTSTEPWATVVIPAYNEGRRIGLTLATWLEFSEACAREIDILVVDDGSVDSTSDVVRRIVAQHPRVRLLRLSDHRGKGSALRAGITAATGRYVCYTDADLPADPAFLPAFIAVLGDRQAAVAIAVRSEEHPPSNTPLARILASTVYRWLVNALVLPEISDSQCGFKVLDRRAVAPLLGSLRINGFAFDIELLRAVLDARLRVVEIPIQIVHRPGSTVRLWHDSIVMTVDLLRITAASGVRRLSVGRAGWANVG